ncbi:MAG: radical SAM protein [Candidatus Omnitrophota bacterium]|nr:radical SAM protein [Candidatus Omnitrophota bacterium]
MLSLLFDYLNKYGLFYTIKKIYDQLSPKAMIKSYLFIKGIRSRDYAYRGPEWVQIDLTNNCNNNCIGCWCNSPLLREKKMNPQTKSKSLPYELVKEFIDEIYQLRTRKIIFSGGGEPFMHHQIMDILRYAKTKRIVCQVHTNFTLIDERLIKELIEIKLDYLTVSLWAATAKTYKLIHSNKDEDTFYRIKDMLTLLSSFKKRKNIPFVRLHNVITNLNYQELPQMVSFAREVKADYVSFAPVDAISDYTDSLLLSDEQRNELLNLADSLKNNDGFLLFDFDEFIRKISSESASRGDYDKDIIDAIPCYAGWLFARLNADGSINSCLKSHRIPVGNIYEQRFSQIWNSEKQREFRRKTRKFKKDDPYFSLIGNEPSASVGCWRGCDDFGMNIRMHRKLTLLSPLLKLMGVYPLQE